MSNKSLVVSLSTFGVILSVYAVYVEYKTAHLPEDEDFSALCDIEAIGASCSQVFALPEGHLLSYIGLVPEDSPLNVPNAAIGVLYYFFRLVGALGGEKLLPTELIMFGASAALSASIFLAYQLTILKELCILCWTTHVLNSVLFYEAYKGVSAKYRNPAQPKKKVE